MYYKSHKLYINDTQACVWTIFFSMILDHWVVAFDALLKYHIRNLATKTRIVFEIVDLNEGQGYNASTGIFTAPSGGIYVYDWTILAWRGEYATRH